MRPNTVAPLALILLPLACIAQTNAGLPKPGDPMPPRSWVDKDTGHRVWRLSDEPNSGAFYFNYSARSRFRWFYSAKVLAAGEKAHGASLSAQEQCFGLHTL
jgi:hypothetical protein